MQKKAQKTSQSKTIAIFTATDKCPKCNGKGFVFYQIDGYDYAEKCRCLIAKEQAEAMEHSGLSQFWKTRTFDTFVAKNKQQKKAKELCQNFSSKGAILCGQVGSGKTHLAVAMLLETAKKGFRVKFVNYRNLVRELSQNAMDREYYKKIMYPYKNAELLVLDDLFKSTVSEAQRGYIYELVNARYEKQKTTIVTTEKNISELMEIDEAIASRLIEMAGDFVIDMSGIENQRLGGAI